MAESKVKRENFLTIQGWMLTDLKLKGNELLTYAIIYGFSQADGQYFDGSLQYVADWINGTKRTAINCLQSLTNKGFVTKKESFINGVKSCQYQCIPLGALAGEKLSGVVKSIHGGSENNSTGVMKNLHGDSENISPNNIEDNIDTKYRENIDTNGAPAPNPPQEKPRRRKGTQLTAPEIQALLERYTTDTATLGLLMDWVIVRKAKRAPETEKALTLNLDKLEGMAHESGLTVPNYLEQVIMRGWAAFYPLKSNGWTVPERSRVKTEAEHAAGGHPSGIGW